MAPRTLVTVREFARLTTGTVQTTLDQASVSNSAFDYLCRLAAGFRSNGATLLQVESRQWLRLDGYVGVIETPCGTTVEILPKHVDGLGEHVVGDARALLRKLLGRALDLPVREVGEAAIERFDFPLTEWVMNRFLLALERVVRRGVRSDYVRVEETQRFLRGRLDLTRQLRQLPGRDHIFNIRHDVYLHDRPENRLLKSALTKVCDCSERPDNWRLARELLALFVEIPRSTDSVSDFRAWRSDRLMAHYADARPWCELVLGQQMPLSLAGPTHGLSFMFPMDRLFERTVANRLRRSLNPDTRLIEQSTRHALCTHLEKEKFTLKPDMLLEASGRQSVVLDAKWKRIDESLADKNYGLAQADFYQLFAYAHKYQGGRGDLALIYPRTELFTRPLAPFQLGTGLNLWVLPFDLEAEIVLWPEEGSASGFLPLSGRAPGLPVYRRA